MTKAKLRTDLSENVALDEERRIRARTNNEQRFEGLWTDTGGQVTILTPDADSELLSPRPSQRIINHSLTGFGWGYPGSGPAQLALAILLRIGLSKDEAYFRYQKFKWQVVSRLPQHAFTLPFSDVIKWVDVDRRRATKEGLDHDVGR